MMIGVCVCLCLFPLARSNASCVLFNFVGDLLWKFLVVVEIFTCCAQNAYAK